MHQVAHMTPTIKRAHMLTLWPLYLYLIFCGKQDSLISVGSLTGYASSKQVSVKVVEWSRVFFFSPNILHIFLVAICFSYHTNWNQDILRTSITVQMLTYILTFLLIVWRNSDTFLPKRLCQLTSKSNSWRFKLHRAACQWQYQYASSQWNKINQTAGEFCLGFISMHARLRYFLCGNSAADLAVRAHQINIIAVWLLEYRSTIVQTSNVT